MNAITGHLTADPFDTAATAVNAWRGRCMVSFTRAEHAVTEALVTLASSDPAVPLPHMVGQRYVALLGALSGAEGASTAIAAVESFRRHDVLRSFLCHGVARVLLDRSQAWHVAFTLVTLARNEVDRRILLIGAAEAKAIADELRRDQQRLEGTLRAAVPNAGYDGNCLRIGNAPG